MEAGKQAPESATRQATESCISTQYCPVDVNGVRRISLLFKRLSAISSGVDLNSSIALSHFQWISAEY